MIKKILFIILSVLWFSRAHAQIDNTIVKKDTVTVKDTAVKASPIITKPDTTVTQAVVVKMPDSTLIQKSPIKTLTYKQYDALMKGDDLYDMALPATLNHYPMPDDIIKYKKQLDLSPEQASKIATIAKELHRKRLEMGLIVIKNERILDSLFRTHIIDDGTLIFYANRYGLYQGELRNAILQACYATERLLAPVQIKKLEAIENH